MEQENNVQVSYENRPLDANEQKIIDRIDWKGLSEEFGIRLMDENGKTIIPVKILHQLASRQVTDFVTASVRQSEKFTVLGAFSPVALQLPTSAYAKEAIENNEVIRPVIINPLANPQRRIYGQSVLEDKHLEHATASITRYQYKKDENGNIMVDEKNRPVLDLDRNGNPVAVGSSLENVNIGETVTIEGKTGNYEALVSIDLPQYNAAGYQYRGTNLPFAKACDDIHRQLTAMKEFSGHVLTDWEISKLALGKTIVVDDCKNQKGETYTAGFQYNVVTGNLARVYNAEYRQHLRKQRMEKTQEKAQEKVQAAAPAVKETVKQEAPQKRRVSRQ